MRKGNHVCPSLVGTRGSPDHSCPLWMGLPGWGAGERGTGRKQEDASHEASRGSGMSREAERVS